MDAGGKRGMLHRDGASSNEWPGAISSVINLAYFRKIVFHFSLTLELGNVLFFSLLLLLLESKLKSERWCCAQK